jgi:hypothetical protein
MIVLVDMVQYCTVSYMPGAQGGSQFFGLCDFLFLCVDITVRVKIKFYIAEFCVSVINTSCPVLPIVTVILSHWIIPLQFHQSSSSTKLLCQLFQVHHHHIHGIITTETKLASTPYTVCIVIICISFLISPPCQDSSR